jgi:hypothetical protein
VAARLAATGRRPRRAAGSTGDPDGTGRQVVSLPAPSPGTPSVRPALTRVVLAAIALIAGLLATIDGPAPTGDASVDALLVGGSVALVTWLGAAATRWDAAVVVLLAGCLSFSIVGTIVGVTAAAVGVTVRVGPAQRSVVSTVLVGIAMNGLARGQLGGVLGASTMVAVVLGVYIAAMGLSRRNRRTQLVVVYSAVGAVTIAFVTTALFVALGTLATDDLRDGNRLAEVGLRQLGEGQIEAARQSFDDAGSAFEAAEARISTPLITPLRFVPVVAQHHRAATVLSADAAEASRFLSNELQLVDLDALAITAGRIDLDRVRAVQAPLRAVQRRIDALQSSVAGLDSQWLLPPFDKRLADITVELGTQRVRSGDALAAAVSAPDILGGEGARTYFLAFTTPAEARGIGGFMGNWAEITIDDGVISLTAFGRADDLNEAGDVTRRRFSGVDEWLGRYGRYSLSSGPGGTTGREPWKNITMSPDMVATGRAIASLYPQSGGRELDGVFVLDVYTLTRFLNFTGPIPLPDGQLVDGLPTLSVDNAAEFLLNDQYDVTRTDERVDVLEDFSRSVIDALLAGTLPPPVELLDVLGPMVDQGRFTGWLARADEQALLERIGMSGTLPAPGSSDALAIVFNNAVGNKIDYYLAADAVYSVAADASSGTVTAELRLRLTNGAPSDGEPNYVIGNPIGLPDGVNRTLVSVFSRLPVTEVRVNGEIVEPEPGAEADYFVTSMFVVVPSGGTATLSFEMAGPLDVADGYDLVMRTPPTVAPTPVTVAARWTDHDGMPHEITQRRRDPGRERLQLSASTSTD